jgi:hypothetical protein
VSQSPNRAAIQRISELLSEEIPNEGELTLKKRVAIKDTNESYILKCVISSSKASNKP